MIPSEAKFSAASIERAEAIGVEAKSRGAGAIGGGSAESRGASELRLIAVLGLWTEDARLFPPTDPCPFVVGFLLFARLYDHSKEI